MNALGQWANAPLGYVVAEVQFQRLVDPAPAIGALCGRVEDAYPVREEAIVETVSTDPAGRTQQSFETIVEVKSFDGTSGLRVTQTALAVHTVAYPDWQHFRKNLSMVMDAIASTMKPKVQLRLGLRYVDLIIPREGESPDDYFKVGFRPAFASVEGVGILEQSNLSARFKDGDIASRISVLSRVPVPMYLPPNFIPMGLNLSLIQKRALDFLQAKKGAISMLDVDVGVDGVRPFSVDTSMTAWDEMHKKQSALFKSVVSDHAIKVWTGA